MVNDLAVVGETITQEEGDEVPVKSIKAVRVVTALKASCDTA